MTRIFEYKQIPLKNGLFLFQFDAGESLQTLQKDDCKRVIRSPKDGHFRLPYKSKKGFWPTSVEINAMLVNCCQLGVFERFYENAFTLKRVEEKREQQALEGDAWYRIYGWREDGNFYFRHHGGVGILPFYCLAIDWTRYEHLRDEFLSYWGNHESFGQSISIRKER